MSEYLKPEYYIKAIVPSEKGIGLETFEQIVTMEPFHVKASDIGLTTDFAEISTGTVSGFIDIDKLEPKEKPAELYQVRWGVKDGCTYKIKLPSGTERLGVFYKKDVGYIDAKKSSYLAPDEDFEFWLLHSDYPSIQAENDTGHNTTPEIWFSGMKYNIQEVTDKETLEKLRNNKIPYRVIIRGGLIP